MFGILLVIISLKANLFPYIERIGTPIAPKNAVSITFDDGPHPTHTREILDILKQKKVHAAFFIIGLHIPRDQKIIQREVREGHIVGGHSYSHPIFTSLSLPSMAKEVFFPHIKILSLTGKYPTYFRFPYGKDDLRIRKFYRGKVIGWNVDAYDWKVKNPEFLAAKIVAQTHTGSIILLHDIKEDTVKALPYIIDGIRSKHLEFSSLPSLLEMYPQNTKDDVIYYGKGKTGTLHDQSKGGKSHPPSTEEILKPMIVTEVSPW